MIIRWHFRKEPKNSSRGTHVFLGQKGPKRAKIPKSISPEPLVVESCLTPQNDRKPQLSISVSYSIYPSRNRKCHFWAKKGKIPKSISPDPLVIESCLIPQHDRKPQLSICVWYDIYPSGHRKCSFWAKRAKIPNLISPGSLVVDSQVS